MADTLLPPKANHRLGASASSTSQQQQQQHQEQQQPTNGMIEIRDIKLHLRQKSYKYTANLSCRTTKQQQQLSASSRAGNQQQQFTTNAIASSIFNSDNNNNDNNTVDADPTLASSFSGIEDIEKKITSELDASTSIEIKNTNNNNNDSTRNSSNLDNNNSNNDNNDKRTSSLNNSITVQEGTTGKPVPDICFGADTKFRLTFPLSMVRDQSGSITPRGGGGGVSPRSVGGSTNVTPSASPQRVSSSSNRNSAASNNEQEGTVATTTTSLKRRGSFSLQGKLANPDDLISQAKLKLYVTLIITKYIDELDVEKLYEQTVLVDLSKGKVNHCKVEFGEVGGASFEVRSVEVEEVEEVLNKSFGSLGGMMMSKELSQEQEQQQEQQQQQEQEEEDVKKENEEDVRKEEENVKTANDDDNTHDKKNDNDDDENTRNSNTEPKEIEVKPTEVAQDAEIGAEEREEDSLTKNKNSEPLSGSASGGYGTIDNVATETQNTKEGTKSSKQNKKKETDALLPKQQKKEKSDSCCCCCC